MNRKAVDVLYCGDDSQQILVLTDDGQIYKSIDFGQSWKGVRRQLDQLHSIQNIKILSLMQNHIDNSTIIVVDYRQENMITYDCGDSYQVLNEGLKMKSIQFHQTDPQIMAALDSKDSMLITQNKGMTWTDTNETVKEFSFAKFMDEDDFTNPDRLFLIIQEKSPKGLVRNLYFSDNFLKEKVLILENVQFFKVTMCCLYVR